MSSEQVMRDLSSAPLSAFPGHPIATQYLIDAARDVRATGPKHAKNDDAASQQVDERELGTMNSKSKLQPATTKVQPDKGKSQPVELKRGPLTSRR
jgi:hypothetical protein